MLRTFLKAAALSACLFSSASAESLASPTGNVLLTVLGNLEIVNKDASAQLDLAMLEALEKTTVETSTIWTEGVQVFEGVSLATLAVELGISGKTLRATAINDYAVEIPMTDVIDGGAVVAYRLNGETMSVREKGPLWIIYPYDADADYRTEVIYSRSIWQLDRLEALD